MGMCRLSAVHIEIVLESGIQRDYLKRRNIGKFSSSSICKDSKYALIIMNFIGWHQTPLESSFALKEQIG